MEDLFQIVGIQNKDNERIAAPRYSYWRSVFRRFFSSKVAIIMLAIIIVVIIMSIIHPLISGYNHDFVPHINDRSYHYLKPSLEHLFGTDNVGRDMFGALWTGTRNSLFIAFSATLITVTIGVIVGAFWGYSKKMDIIMIELYNIIANIPFTLLVIILMYILGPGIRQLIFSLSVTSWLGVAYFIRVQVMIIRDREYNLASRCLGTPISKVIIHNILPFLISVIVTTVSRDIPAFISYEVFLSYLGIGLDVKTPSLGVMIQNYASVLNSVPHLFWLPVFVGALISVSLYIVGQTLADASDPRTHMI